MAGKNAQSKALESTVEDYMDGAKSLQDGFKMMFHDYKQDAAKAAKIRGYEQDAAHWWSHGCPELAKDCEDRANRLK